MPKSPLCGDVALNIPLASTQSVGARVRRGASNDVHLSLSMSLFTYPCRCPCVPPASADSEVSRTARSSMIARARPGFPPASAVRGQLLQEQVKVAVLAMGLVA